MIHDAPTVPTLVKKQSPHVSDRNKKVKNQTKEMRWFDSWTNVVLSLAHCHEPFQRLLLGPPASEPKNRCWAQYKLNCKCDRRDASETGIQLNEFRSLSINQVPGHDERSITHNSITAHRQSSMCPTESRPEVQLDNWKCPFMGHRGVSQKWTKYVSRWRQRFIIVGAVFACWHSWTQTQHRTQNFSARNVGVERHTKNWVNKL